MYGFGKIQAFGDETDDNGDAYTARVVPEYSDGTVTMPLYIPLNLRKIMQNVAVGETVFYAENGQSGGVIIALIPPYTDGTYQDWDLIIRNTLPLQIEGDVHVKGNITLDGDMMTAGNTNIEGNLAVDTDTIIEGNTQIKGNLDLKGDSATAGNSLVKGNADIVGNIAVDGTADLGHGVQVTASGTNIGGQVQINGTTPTGSMAFGGFPGGVDPIDGVPASQNMVLAPPLAGMKATGNQSSYSVDECEKDEYEKAEDNTEREA